MNITRLYAIPMLLCLFFAAQRVDAQCDFTLSANATNTSCFGGSNGAIDLTVNGGTPPLQFEWPNGAQDEDLLDLAAGSYTVTVTNGLGCSKTLTSVVNQASLLSVAVSGDDINCFYVHFTGLPIYQTDLTATAQGGTAPYFYIWSNNGSGNTQTFNAAGTYTVTVIDGNSCQATAEKVVEADTFPPAADAGPDVNFDCQTAQVTLGGNGSSTGPGIYFTWTGPGITTGPGGNENRQFPTISVPGVYTLEVYNEVTLCSGQDVVVVGGFLPPVANAGPDTGIPCGGGQITLDGSGSSSGIQFSYQWTTANGNIIAGANTQNPLVDLPGTYTLLVTDTQNGCTKTDDVRVFPGPVIPPSDLSLLDVSCTGQLGIAAVNMNQGAGPYTYLWSNGSTQAAIINIFQGTYTVTVTDATGCNYFGEVQIKDTSTLTLSALTTAPSCGVGNGAIDLTAIGLYGAFEYAWNTGETTQDLNNLPAGTYTVTVTYAGATCTQTLSVTLADSSGMTLSTIATVSSCFIIDGTIDVTVGGGSPPYTYAWSDGGTTKDRSSLAAGTYTITVTESNNCTKTASATVGLAIELTLSAVVTASTACAFSNGIIDLTVTPSGNFTYIWSDGTTTEDKPDLLVGNYTVTVSAGGLCTANETFMVPYEPNLPIPTAIPTPTTCDLSNGSINASVTGGVAPYLYQWSNGATTQGLSNIPAGNYDFTVTGANGCTNTISVDVTNNNLSLNLIEVISANNVCLGPPNGSINLAVIPLGSYSYGWSNGATSQSLTGLTAGAYEVTVSAGGSCTQTEIYTVPDQTNSPNISSTVTDASCSLNDGAIDLTVSGGTPGYTYNWNDGNTTEDIAGLSSGIYTVTVMDSGGCTQTATVTVGQSSTLFATATVTQVLCFGGNNGSVDLTVTGGTPGYTYLWSNGATAQDMSGLVAGTYTVTVTDAAGCSRTGSVTILQPTALNLTTTSVNVLCNGGNNGSINLTVTGGTPVYTYLWPNGATAQDPSGLTAGTYTVTVTDAQGCTMTRSSTISEPTPLNLTTQINTVSCFGGNNGAVNLTISGGVPPYIYAWSNTATTQDLSNLISGIYSVTVTDANNCTISSTYAVNQPTQITFTIVSLSNTCNTESITGPNLPNFTYEWTGPNGFTATTAGITANFSGLYNLVITDQNGCTASNSYTVNLSGGGTCGAIKGRVYHDEDESCSLNSGEPGLAGWIVRAEGVNDTLYGVTNAQGQYLVGVPTGTYAMKVFVPNGLWTICPGGILATVGMAGDTVSGGDFPVQSTYLCPALTVSIGTNKLRRCSSDNYYEVEYCNQGTQKAEDAYITVVLDQFLTAISASVPYTDFGSNVLHIEVGDLAIGECGALSIKVAVNCNAVLGQTHCTQASIYPDTLCAPTNTNWSGASLSLQSACSNDSLRFIIRNDGKATMATTRDYIVVEDGIMFRSGVLTPLLENDSMVITVPANGSTWRVEVGQESFHPYPAPIGLSVEGCATASFSTGFVNQFPTPDEPPTLDIDCTTNIGSFDPNDKHGYPVGYGADHYVRPGTDIEYLVRFQNTGTDTAFIVHIIDTLSTWLDPSSIRFGASSHPYRYDLDGEGVVHFIFEDIFLPDSNTNEVASHGFAKFTIKPRFDAALETVIENTAAIYFDFNDPVYTNTTFHRLGLNFVTVGLWQPFVPDAQVIAVPNPFNEETTLEVKGLRRNDALHLQVFDLQGRMVREMDSENAFFHLKKGDWQTGIYLFKITQNGRLVGNGKLMAE